MIQDRHSNHMKPNGLPGRDANACAATTIGAPEQALKAPDPGCADRFKAQLAEDAAPTVPSLACSVSRIDQMAHRRGIRQHSTPIAAAVGGAA
jgi:hypothetical protein